MSGPRHPYTRVSRRKPAWQKRNARRCPRCTVCGTKAVICPACENARCAKGCWPCPCKERSS